MGRNGRHRWKISFYHRSPSSSSSSSKMEANPNPNPNSARDPPKDYLCPIHGSLMADPVVVASGHTFERVSAELCRDLGLSPALDDGSSPDFSAVIPNRAIGSAILAWCADAGVPPPHAPARAAVERLLRGSVASAPELRVSERELIEHLADQPPVTFSHAETELGPRVNHHHRRFYSSSSEESVVVAAENPGTPLPFATRPLSYNNYHSSSSSSEIAEVERPSSSAEEDELTRKMRNQQDVAEQEEAAISLRRLTRTREDLRVSLCNPRLLAALKPLIASRYGVVQSNAIAALVNLSLEKPNKVMIVRSGFVPVLIDALKSGPGEAQEHAVGALFSLALEDDNKTAIGVLGALPPLMHALVRSDSERTRHDSALALYHLTLVQSNRAKLVRLGSVPTLLALSRGGPSASRVLLVLCNLAACPEGRSAMLDADAVRALLALLAARGEPESTRENCVAALFALSRGNMRFRGLAREAGAVEALREVEESGSDRAREKARRMLQMMRGRDGSGGDDEDRGWRSLTETGGGGGGGVVRNLHGANSTTF